MMEFYWKLDYGDWKDLKTVYIAPASVVSVQRRWDSGQPVHTPNGSIPANMIRGFDKSDRPYRSQQLLEGAAQAFHEPLYSADGDIESRWVKKVVTQNRWEKYFSGIPAYKYLRDEGGMALIAFMLPVHQINQQNTPYCTDIEVQVLTHNRQE